MKLNAQQLSQHLQKNLAPIYIVSGDEPLLVQECCEQIIYSAKQQGYQERDVLHAQRTFAWEQLLNTSQSLSLFSEKRIIDLRLITGKPGTEGGKVLQQLAAKPPSDTLLLIRSGKLDSATQKTKWLKALLAVGVFIQVWPLTAQQLPTWLAERLKKVNIHCTPAGLQLLADRVEGNLLAAQQEIEKLTLLHGAGSQLDEHDIEHAVIMSSRYDVFRLVDACLAGQSQQIVHIMHTLKAEGIEAILVLWALARECRLLARLAYQQQQGQALSTLLRQERVFESRHSMVKTALQRGNLPLFYSLLQQAKRIDDMIKGAQPGRVWDALLRLSLHLAGTRL